MWNMWNGGFVDEQTVQLNSGVTAQQPAETAVTELPCMPAYVGLPADYVWLNMLVNPIQLPESTTLYPPALHLVQHTQTRPRTHQRAPSSWPYQRPIPLCPGLRGHGLTTTQEKCYDPRDPTLRFVDREDELDFLCEGFTSRRALMSCGHAVTPTSLTNWCLKLLEEGKSRFVCGQSGCNVEWSYTEVCKMALLTYEEMKHFEKAMTSNAARENTKSCPGCKSPVVRVNQYNLRVCCTVCTTNRSQVYDFCWQCLREWKGPASRSDHCDNDGCCNESLKTLTTCPEIKFGSVKCPSIRACTKCGILLQHDNKACKNAACPRCKVEFCFVCLKVGCYRQCHVAPRQTSIPVWHKK